LAVLAAVVISVGASVGHAGEAPSRVVPSAFVDTDASKPCAVQIQEQGFTKDIAQVQAAVHACIKGRFNRLKTERPDLFPVEGKPQNNRPK
jgi:hypothetical protein